MAAQAYWSGRIRLALVSIPVEVVSATVAASRIAFHQIHKPTGKRVRYEKIVPGVGPIDSADIVKGYEVEKGKYVLLTSEDIDTVKLEAKKSIDLVQFVDEHEIDPVYFDRPFFVLPKHDDEDAAEAYAVLRDALAHSHRVGLGQIVVRGQGSVVAIKPWGKGLLMETLHYADEVKKPDKMFDTISAPPPDREMLTLAEQLIKRKSAPFEPGKFKDSYSDALRELIDAKLEMRPPKAIEDAPPPSNVINLMEALKRSISGDNTPAKEAKETKSAKTVKAKPAKSAARKPSKPSKPAGKGGRKKSAA